MSSVARSPVGRNVFLIKILRDTARDLQRSFQFPNSMLNPTKSISISKSSADNSVFIFQKQREDNWIQKNARLQKINNSFTFVRQAKEGNSGSAKVRHTVKEKIIKRCIFILIRNGAAMSRGIRQGVGEARYLKLQACTECLSRGTPFSIPLCSAATFRHASI